jgi:hypothetical protein
MICPRGAEHRECRAGELLGLKSRDNRLFFRGRTRPGTVRLQRLGRTETGDKENDYDLQITQIFTDRVNVIS